MILELILDFGDSIRKLTFKNDTDILLFIYVLIFPAVVSTGSYSPVIILTWVYCSNNSLCMH